MLYHLSLYFRDSWHLLNVVHYVSFRILAGLLSAMFFSFLFGEQFIAYSRRFFRSKTREVTPKWQRTQEQLPTMGGLFILSMVLLNTILWCNLAHTAVWLMLGLLLGFGAIGAWDDWSKINRSKGISAVAKSSLQLLVSFIIVSIWVFFCGAQTTITFPFFKAFQPDLGMLFIPWAMFVLIGTSNGVNLTDGLDGLAIGSLIPNFFLFTILCYLSGNIALASYLHIPFSGTAEIAIMGAIFVGASIGFLWYNAYPAQIFMGDVGSLALGAGLGFMALLCKQELLLAISGGIFVAETLSVILQLGSYRLRGKKLFKMAPMHHHFELLGWQEAKITVRFAVISFILCLLALITIKIR